MRHDQHWLDMTDRILFLIAVTVYRCFYGIAPDCLSACVHPASHRPSSQYSLRSVNRNQLVVPIVRLPTYGRRCFSVSGPTVWNNLSHGCCTVSRRFSALCQKLVVRTLTPWRTSDSDCSRSTNFLLLRRLERRQNIVISMSVCVCLSVCLSAVRQDISGTTLAIFTNLLCMLPTSVAWSSAGSLTIGRIAYRREGVTLVHSAGEV